MLQLCTRVTPDCTRVTEELHSFLNQSELSNFFVYIIKRQSIQEWTLNLNWSEKIVKTKNLFWNKFNVSDFSTPFLSRQLSRAYNMVLVIGVKLYRNDLKGNKNYFELVGGLFCRTFVIPVALCNKLDVDGRRTSNPIISIIIDNDNSNSPTI